MSNFTLAIFREAKTQVIYLSILGLIYWFLITVPQMLEGNLSLFSSRVTSRPHLENFQSKKTFVFITPSNLQGCCLDTESCDWMDTMTLFTLCWLVMIKFKAWIIILAYSVNISIRDFKIFKFLLFIKLKILFLKSIPFGLFAYTEGSWIVPVTFLDFTWIQL